MTAVPETPQTSTGRPWLRWTLRRALRLLVSLWVLVSFSFLVIHLVPGDPARAALGARASTAAVEALRDRLGLEEPLLRQYGTFLGDLVRGRLGESVQLRTPVAEVIGDRLPATLALAGLAFLVVVAVAVPLGLAMALRTRGGRHRGTELAFTGSSVVVAAVPDFCLAVVLVAVLAVGAGLLPIAGDASASAYLIPVVALAAGPAAALSRLVRVEALGVLDEDFVRTARAKRLSTRRIALRHVLPNALTASLTVGGLTLTGLIAGTVLVESVVGWPGLGPRLVEAIIDKDYPLVQGIVLVYGGLVLLVNLLVDAALIAVDPRAATSGPST